MYELADSFKSKAYSPYSKFMVGASVLADDGRIFGGCNIENSSYSATICAERVAIFKAISEGARYIKAILITSNGKDTFPCGICRQVIGEFSREDTKIIISNSLDDYRIYTIDELLPYKFSKENLDV
ncbi:MAG: cytidine deaminase [Finegoldia sp.]|nr:cytidine deaminase [Finegoldia sp.]